MSGLINFANNPSPHAKFPQASTETPYEYGLRIEAQGKSSVRIPPKSAWESRAAFRQRLEAQTSSKTVIQPPTALGVVWGYLSG